MRGLLDSPAPSTLAVCAGWSSCNRVPAPAPAPALPTNVHLSWGLVTIAFTVGTLLLFFGPVLCCVVHGRLRQARLGGTVVQGPEAGVKLDLKANPVPFNTVNGIFVVQPNRDQEIATIVFGPHLPQQEALPCKGDSVGGDRLHCQVQEGSCRVEAPVPTPK